MVSTIGIEFPEISQKFVEGWFFLNGFTPENLEYVTKSKKVLQKICLLNLNLKATGYVNFLICIGKILVNYCYS